MAEFHPELTEEQRADRLLSLQLEALNIRAAIAETKHQLDVLKSIDDQLVQHLVEKFGIDPDKLRITVVEHEAEAAPDLDISVGTFEPANPVFAALNAMRNQFEHPSLRMVNTEYDIDE